MEATETPMRDHIAEFWRLLETEHVRILVDIRRQTEAMTYYDSSSFGDDVAKALVADRAARPSPTGEKVEAVAAGWRWTFDGEMWAFSALRPGKFRFGQPNVVEPVYSAETVVALEAERDEARRLLKQKSEQRDAEFRRAALAETDLATANARVERLEKALEPFADVSGEGDEDFPDDTTVTLKFGRTLDLTLTLGDFRRAALTGGEND